jgi:hypothetical protein
VSICAARKSFNPLSAFPAGLGPREAIPGLGHRVGFATLAAHEAPACEPATTEDLLIPQGVDSWTSSWLTVCHLASACTGTDSDV